MLERILTFCMTEPVNDSPLLNATLPTCILCVVLSIHGVTIMYAGYWLDKTFFSSSVLCWSSNKTAGWRAVELCNDLLPSPQMLAQGHYVLNSLALCHPFHFTTCLASASV